MWVFGYGSLLWDPGFTPVDTSTARLSGWHRSFCLLSVHHRGTAAMPGLVLALDAREGAVCDGVAFRVADHEVETVHAALRARELVTSAYIERFLPVTLSDGRSVDALVYVIDPAHEQYCDLSLETQAAMIARAHGGRGPNCDYLYNTAAHLDALGVDDPAMAALVTRVRHLRGDQVS